MTEQEISLGELDNNPMDIRQRVNVNSPKGKAGKTHNFPIAPTSLITSVRQGDEQGQKELAKQMAKRAEDSGENRKIESGELSGRPRCFSCWLCCGSCSITNDKHLVKLESSANENDNTNTTIVDSEQGGNTKATESESKVCSDKQSDKYKPIGGPNKAPASEVEWLLASASPSNRGKKCLVLDLDETLVHSSFQPIECSFAITIELDGAQYGVSVLKRPFVDEFIEECAKLYELVIFTASLAEYANPVIDRLDRRGLIKHRLFRESCVFHEETAYVKDLSRLGRDLKDCIIIDNSPLSYLFHPTNAIGCTSWFGDKSDTELRDLLPVLRGQILSVNDVRTILDAGCQSCEWLIKNYGDTTKSCEPIITE